MKLREFREVTVPPAGNLHVTLAFLGELPPARLPDAAEAVQAAGAAAGGTWRIAWGKTGAFPSSGRPRVLWLGLADPVMTTTVQGLLVAELRARGLPTDERPFRPHLTLARVNGSVTRDRADALKALLDEVKVPTAAHVRSLVLYRSSLGREGSVYEELARSDLNGAGPA